MAEILKTTFQLRRGYEAAWEKNNPILASGEPGFATDKNILKIGDGHTAWKDLEPVGLSEAQASLLGDEQTIVIKENQISIKGFEEALPGAQPVKTSDGTLAWIIPSITIDQLEQSLKDFQKNVYTKQEIEVLYQDQAKFEIFSKPKEAIVSVKDYEIRILCPANTTWTKQETGATNEANIYYIGFRAYAPKDAAGFKEGTQGAIINEYFDFSDPLAGTDEYGRNYSISWLPVASYDVNADNWTYFGENSSIKEYSGWDYVVEWYDSEKNVIMTDSIRINLSNEECHNFNKPYFMGAINVNTLIQSPNESLVLYGGSASDNI